MYILLLDSSNTKLSVGVATSSQVIESISYEAWQQQSEFMVPEIDKLLSKRNIDPKEINRIIVSIGPGSYTGVRIALTIAKVMGLATNATIYPVSSLQIIKKGEHPSICLINARSSRSYIGVYQQDKVILKDTIFTNEAVKEYISNHPEYSLCGDLRYLGLEGYEANVIEEMFSLKNQLTPLNSPLELKPVYLKD